MSRDRFRALGGDAVYRAKGCPACCTLGLPRPHRHLRAAADRRRHAPAGPKNVDSGTIKKKAMEKGMLTLLDDGARKVAQGRDHHRRGAVGHPGGPLSRHGRLRVQGPQRGREDRHRPEGGRLGQDPARACCARTASSSPTWSARPRASPRARARRADAPRSGCRATSTCGKLARGRINTDDVAVMTRQLATLLGAGVALVEALTALVDQVEKEQLKRVLSDVKQRVNEGSSLADALRAPREDLRRALREHDPRRRELGRARRGAAAAGRVHRGPGAAARRRSSAR